MTTVEQHSGHREDRAETAMRLLDSSDQLSYDPLREVDWESTVEPLPSEIGDGHMEPEAREAPGDGQADARGAARDDGDRAGLKNGVGHGVRAFRKAGIGA